MKLQVLSIFHTYGVSRDTGNAYSMRRVLSLTPLVPAHMGEEGKKGWYNREGAGLSTMELPVVESFYPTLLARFQQIFKGVPLEWDFETTVQPRGRGTETVISGFAVDPVMGNERPLSAMVGGKS